MCITACYTEGPFNFSAGFLCPWNYLSENYFLLLTKMNGKYFEGIFLSILDYIYMFYHEEDIGMQVHFEKHINFYRKETLDIFLDFIQQNLAPNCNNWGYVPFNNYVVFFNNKNIFFWLNVFKLWGWGKKKGWHNIIPNSKGGFFLLFVWTD